MLVNFLWLQILLHQFEWIPTSQIQFINLSTTLKWTNFDIKNTLEKLKIEKAHWQNVNCYEMQILYSDQTPNALLISC